MANEEVRDETAESGTPAEVDAPQSAAGDEPARPPRKRRSLLRGALLGIPLGLAAAVAASKQGAKPGPLDGIRARLEEALRQGRQAARETEERKQAEYQEKLRGR